MLTSLPNPTSLQGKSQLWGFEVSHIVGSFMVLAIANVGLQIMNLPLIFSWVMGLLSLGVLRIMSIGQKSGHLELLARFYFQPHIYLGHRFRSHTITKGRKL